MITVDPPDVQPSLGDIALMQGVATGSGGYRPAVKHDILINLIDMNMVGFTK